MASSITYSTTGSKIREDTNLAFRQNTSIATYDSTFSAPQKGWLKEAIIAAGNSLLVDTNGKQSTSFTVTASVDGSSVSIYIG